jgi:hypothetical protein
VSDIICKRLNGFYSSATSNSKDGAVNVPEYVRWRICP